MIGRLSKHEKPEVENSDMAQECLDNAAHWERRAASAIDDPAAKAMFEQLAHVWYQLARCWREARITRLNCGTCTEFAHPKETNAGPVLTIEALRLTVDVLLGIAP